MHPISSSRRRARARWPLATLLAVLTVCGAPRARASSSIEPTRISLPKGPGSIHGLGRSFEPSLASGTSSYGVDIDVPPGAGGFGPKVSIDYDSGGGVSDVGMGWRLGGIPSLRRRVEEGLPRFDPTDTFEVDGFGVPSRLVEVSPGLFRPEFESGSFVRAERAADGPTWEARDKAGTTYRFGGTNATEAEGAHVATYLLREAVDLHGHRVAYAWDTSSGHARLTSITWNDYGDDVRNVVALRYEDRPDPHVIFSSGIKQVLAKRLVAVEVTHGGALVRRYELAYKADVHSRLASVTLVGRDGTSRQPVLSFDYTALGLAGSGTVVAMASPPGRTPGDPNVELADLDGDTLPDLLVTRAGAYRSYLNHDGRSWKEGVDWPASTSPSFELGATGVQLADIDGDGAIDLVAKSGVADFRYLPGATATRFGDAVSIRTVPNVTFEDLDVRLADMDEDRRVDVVVTTPAGLAIGYNRSGIDWTMPSVVGVVDARQALRFSDGGHTQLCDVNGDRVQDFCYLRSGSLVYWLGRGRGVFEPPVTATSVPSFDPSSPWELRDLDGDGWVDLVHVGVDEVDVALAVGAGHFDAPKMFSGTPTRGPTTTVRFADMNGSGSVDIVWIDVAGAPAQAWRYLELFPQGRAGLLSRIDNGLGHVVSIDYGTAAEDAAAARDAGAPWTSRMNAGMPVVRRVSVDNGLGDPLVRVESHYRDGTWSPVERTFAGFGSGLERAVGDEFTPTLFTDYTYDVGIADRTQRGLVLMSGAHDERGYRFARTLSTYTSRSIGTGLDGSPLHYTFKASEEHTEIEGTDESHARTTSTEWDQDSFGNVIAERRWGEAVAGDKLAGHDESITRRTFANNIDDWILGHLATEEMQDARGARVAMKRVYYDGAPFVGLPLGQVTRGNATRQEAWAGPAPDAFELDIGTGYDSDGHPIETRDARGGGHFFTWDAHDHGTFISESAKLDGYTLTSTAETDRAFGNLTSVTGYDGQTTRFHYDAFGRLVDVVEPGDSDDKPTRRYSYIEASPLSRVVTEARIWRGKDDVERSEDVIDGAGQKRATLTRDDGGRWVLAGVSLFDARGNARRALRARFVGDAEHAAPPVTVDGAGDSSWRDAMGRVVRARSQLGIETRKEYAPFVVRSWDGAQNDPSSPYEHTPSVTEHDGLGRLVRTSETFEGQTLAATFAYDAAGALLTKTDADRNTARYTYDGRGRRVSVNDPDAGHHAFVHDATGNLVEHHKPDGTVTRSTFDIGGRPLTEDWNGDGKPEVVHTWDRSPRHPGDALYAGKLVSMTDPSGSVENEYDERQRVVAVHRTIDGKTYDDASYFDDRDREILHTYPDSSSIRIRYNPRGQLAGYGRAITIAYDGDGVELQRVFNTGVVEETGYDDDRRKTASRVRATDGRVVQDLAWTYDGAGNIARVDDRRAGIDPASDRSESYSLDNLYRLRGVAGAWGRAAWKYSASGNVVERTSTVAALQAGEMRYGESAGPHALTSTPGRTIGYDALGRMRDDGDRSYAWDAADQLVRVTAKNGATVESVFDGAGGRRQRVERADGGDAHTTHFVDAWSEARDGKLVRFIVHGGKRIARLAEGNGAVAAGAVATGGSRLEVREEGEPPATDRRARLGAAFALLGAALAFWLSRLRRPVQCAPVFARGRLAPAALFLAAVAVTSCSAGGDDGPNLEGTVLALTDADTLLFSDAIGSLTEETSGAGAPRASFASFPYGLTRFDTSGQTRKYANTPRDGEVGLDQMGARSYAADLGVWTSADPVAVEDPLRGVGHTLGASNPYAYAGQNPTIATDEHGRWVHIAIGAAVGGLLGGGAEAYRQYAESGHITSWGRIAGHAAVGVAVGAAVAAMPSPATIGGAIAIGAGAGAVTGVAERLIDSGGKSVGTVGQFVTDTVIGGATGGLAHAAAPVLRKVASVIAEKAGSAASEAVGTLRVRTAIKGGSAGGAGAKPAEAYNRAKHYGRTPTRADRQAIGAGAGEVADHDPPLVKRYYEGDPAIGEKPGWQMTPEERAASASDRSRMQPQPRSESNSQGATMRAYSQGQKKAHGL